MFQNNSFNLGQQSGVMGGGGGMDSAMRPQIGVGGGMMPQQPAQPYQPQMAQAQSQPQPYNMGGGLAQPQMGGGGMPQQNLLAMLQRMQGGGMGGAMPQPQPGMMGGGGGFNPGNMGGWSGAQPQQFGGGMQGANPYANLMSMLFGGR